LGSTSESYPRSGTPASLAIALSRGFVPPRRNPSAEIHHPRALPAQVTLRPRTYHVPRRFAPSTDSLVLVPTRCVHGASPFRALPGRDHRRLSAGLPLLRLAFRPPCRHKACFVIGTSPRLTVAKTGSSNKPQGPVPLGSVVLRRFRRIGIAAAAASLQGLSPSAGWGCLLWGFLLLAGPWLSWAFPPWGFLLPRLDLDGRCRLSRNTQRPRVQPPPTVHTAGCLCPRLVSSQALQGTPVLGLLPVLQSFKELGSWRYLFRGCRPLRGFCPHPNSLVRTKQMGVGSNIVDQDFQFHV
jgi:hypothetical protein